MQRVKAEWICPPLLEALAHFQTGIGVLYGIFIYFKILIDILWTSSENPDQTLHYAVSDLALHWMPMSYKRMLGLYCQYICDALLSVIYGIFHPDGYETF